ncbi:unnamed protein product, partial [Vitis vinifera]
MLELQSEEVLVDESLHIPTIDMRKLMVDDDEMEKLHFACKDWGFFQLINHGVEEEVIVKMMMDVQDFFKLSLEEKNAYAQLPNDIEGYGQAFVVSRDQKLDWGDMLFLLPLPASQRNMRLWPKKPTSFRETLEKYSSELHRVSINLLRSMAKNLGINPDKLATMFEDATQGVRMNYYPPLALLVQVNEVQGLQIKKNGKWVPIRPVPDAFIVNIGDIIEIMSNGEYKSIEHRAVVNPEKERLSIAAFHSPNYRTMIGPLPDLLKENSANYKTISFEDFVRIVVTRKLDGKNLLGHMKFAD